MDEKSELKDRVAAKKKRIEARLAELKADASGDARETSEKLQAKLSALGDNLENGWENLTDATAGKLNDWLEDDDKDKP